MDQVDASHHLEQFSRYMERVSSPRRCKVDLSWIGPGIGDEIGNGRRRKGGGDLHDIRDANEASYGRDVMNEIEIELTVKRRVDRIRKGNQEERVAVRPCAHHHLGADIATGSWPIF